MLCFVAASSLKLLLRKLFWKQGINIPPHLNLYLKSPYFNCAKQVKEDRVYLTAGVSGIGGPMVPLVLSQD